MPWATRSPQRWSVSRSRARCSSTSSKTPKCVSASRVGRPPLGLGDRLPPRPRDRCRAEASAASTKLRGAIRTPTRVARVERPVLVQHRDVVARVPGAREALEPEDVVADDADVLRGHGHELAPEPVERVAVEPARARLEPARIDQVRRADGRDVHLECRVLADDRACGAGVVEVDVGEQEVADVAELEPALGEAVLQGREAGRRPAVEERRCRRRSRRGSSRRSGPRPGGGGRSEPEGGVMRRPAAARRGTRETG